MGNYGVEDASWCYTKSTSNGNLSLLQTPSRTADIEHDVEEEGIYSVYYM